MDQVSTKPLTSRQQQALATKARIAEAAMHLFAEQGFAATSTKQIAVRAGVSEGLIFRYFPTKLALLRTLSQTRQTLAGEIMSLLEEAHDQPAAVFLPRVAEGFVTLVSSETHFLNMLLSESRTNDELYGVFEQIISDTADALAVYLDKRIGAGELRSDLASQSAARAFFGSLLLFFLTNKHLDDEAWREKSERYVDEILALWFQGAVRRT